MPDLSTLADIKLTTASSGLGVGSDFAFTVPTALFDATPYSTGTVIRYREKDRYLFKGVILKAARSLSAEQVTYQCLGAEQYLEGKEWNAKFDYYNPEAPDICANFFANATIQDFIDQEFTDDPGWPFVSQVKIWFDTITVPVSVAPLIAGSTETRQKSFLTALQSIIAPYPHVKVVIEYDEGAAPDDLFPVGHLVLVDTSIGRDTHTLFIGDTTPNLEEVNITEDETNCAEEIIIYGRGQFTEKWEVLQPAWDPSEEIGATVNGTLEVTDPDDFSPNQSFSYFDFGPAIDIPAAPEVFVGAKKAFEGADYWIDYDNNRLLWLYQDYWVDGSTGQLFGNVGTTPPGTRRPFAFSGEHRTQPITITFKRLGPNAFKRYKTAFPIADLKMRIGRVYDPARPGKTTAQFIDAPVEEASTTFLARPYFEVYSWKLFNPATKAALTTPPYTLPVFKGETQANGDPKILGPVSGTSVVSFSDAFMYPVTNFNFTEGSDCVEFPGRQMGYTAPGLSYIVPALNLGMDAEEAYRPGIALVWFSWEIAIKYTAWENFSVTRTSTRGLGKTLRAVLESALRYTDYQGTVIRDDTATLEGAADAAKDWSDVGDHAGVLTVVIDLETPGSLASLWEIPYKVGDKVNLAGNVSAGIQSLDLIINQIDYSTLDEGRITLSFGRLEPRNNPFAPRPPATTDIEGIGQSRPNISGLEVI